MSEYLIDIQGLCKHFPVQRGLLGALRGAGKEVVRKKGEILALVGESGSGKTTSALCAAGLIPATKGRILLEGRDVLEMIRNRKQRKALRRIAQVIFQDPYESLNPRQTVFDAVAEPLEVHGLVASQEEKRRRVAEALDAAGLKAPESYFNRYPQELSGGQRQRVVIASALVIQPSSSRSSSWPTNPCPCWMSPSGQRFSTSCEACGTAEGLRCSISRMTSRRRPSSLTAWL